MIALERAQALIAAGIEEAGRQDLKLAFAVVDAAGHLVASARMDGAPWIAPEVALGKAWTAAAYGLPSAVRTTSSSCWPVPPLAPIAPITAPPSSVTGSPPICGV